MRVSDAGVTPGNHPGVLVRVQMLAPIKLYRPSSMKYRGLFTKNKCEKDTKKCDNNYDYYLTYSAPMGQFRLKNVIKIWKERYEK